MFFAVACLITLTYSVFSHVISLSGWSDVVVSTSASDQLERLVSEMIETLNPTQSRTHSNCSLIYRIQLRGFLDYVETYGRRLQLSSDSCTDEVFSIQLEKPETVILQNCYC